MQRCLGCMREFADSYDMCPYCGYVVGTEAESKVHLEPGTVLQNRYLLGKVLGQGGFGITYIAWDNQQNRAVAVKEYMPNAFASRMTGEKEVSCYSDESMLHFQKGIEKIGQESSTVASLSDVEGVVRVYDHLEENQTAYIVMELLRGQTLQDALKKGGAFSLQNAAQIMRPVLQTLDALHKKGIIHRDVAPDNIFICEDGRVKLLDFGAARLTYPGMDEKTVSVILKHGYAPREQYSSRSEQGPYTDVYSASATLFKVLTGVTPPESIERTGNDEEELRTLLDRDDLPNRVKQAIVHGMCLNKEQRTQSALELLSALEPYLPQEDTARMQQNTPYPTAESTASEMPATHGKKPSSQSSRWIRLLCVLAVLLAAAVITVIAVTRNSSDDDTTETESVSESVESAADDEATTKTTTTKPTTTKPAKTEPTEAAQTTTAPKETTTKAWDADIPVVQKSTMTRSDVRPDVNGAVRVYCPTGMRDSTKQYDHQWSKTYKRVYTDRPVDLFGMTYAEHIMLYDFVDYANASKLNAGYASLPESERGAAFLKYVAAWRSEEKASYTESHTTSHIYKMNIGGIDWLCYDIRFDSGECWTNAYVDYNGQIHWAHAFSIDGKDDSRSLLCTNIGIS